MTNTKIIVFYKGRIYININNNITYFIYISFLITIYTVYKHQKIDKELPTNFIHHSKKDLQDARTFD